jgi:hypothetical protein
MTVRLSDDGAIVLEGRCPVEDGEALARLLSINPSAPVDWRSCQEAHTAVLQILLAVRPVMRGPPADEKLRSWMEPLLSGEEL